jgi:hypothetical protein
MIAGGLAILQLPVAQYPTIAPPAVAVSPQRIRVLMRKRCRIP